MRDVHPPESLSIDLSTKFQTDKVGKRCNPHTLTLVKDINESCDLDCPPVDGANQRCATIATDGNSSVNECVAEILCGETMELEGVEMSYTCYGLSALE